MKITRELTVNKINVICYDPENKCEITKEMILIGISQTIRSSKRSEREILESLLTGRETKRKPLSTVWMQKYF